MNIQKELTLLLEDEVRLDPNERIFERRSAEAGPKFTVGEAAKTFFGWGSHYLRELDAQGFLGKSDREFGKWRRYDLADIENMAYTLADHGKLDPHKLRDVLTAVWSIASIWRLI